MEGNNLIKKGVAVAVILLFIGLAFAPSINANISKDSEMVEFTTEICGLNGGKNTVQLTKAEEKEVDILFNSIRERLNSTESREEAEEIFNEAIVELDKYGLLGGLSVKQAQRLVTGTFQNQRFFNHMYPRTLDENENKFCLIAGMTSNTYFEGLGALFFSKVMGIFRTGVGLMGYLFFIIIAMINPIAFGNRINLGEEYEEWEGEYEYYYSYGWVFTMGTNGIKTYKRKMEGVLPIQGSYLNWGDLSYSRYFPGVVGFTGIKIDSSFYLGCALWVKIKEYN